MGEKMFNFSRKPRSRKPISICAAEVMEVRQLLSSVVPSIDGTGNNIANPTQGSAGTDLLRISPVAYANGNNTPSLSNNPGTRVISDALNNQALPSDPTVDAPTVDGNSLSDFGYSFGQFIDHDMDLTPTAPAITFNNFS